MQATTLSLTVLRGATFRQTLIWKAAGTPVDLTGFTARMQARSTAASTTVLLYLTTENGGITLGGVLGTIDLYVSDTATSAIDWEHAVYDLELIAPNGDVTRLVQGPVTTSKEVTR